MTKILAAVLFLTIGNVMAADVLKPNQPLLMRLDNDASGNAIYFYPDSVVGQRGATIYFKSFTKFVKPVMQDGKNTYSMEAMVVMDCKTKSFHYGDMTAFDQNGKKQFSQQSSGKNYSIDPGTVYDFMVNNYCK